MFESLKLMLNPDAVLDKALSQSAGNTTQAISTNTAGLWSPSYLHAPL